jgi:uncharacterized protein YjbI with pentapeptide repeats
VTSSGNLGTAVGRSPRASWMEWTGPSGMPSTRRWSTENGKGIFWDQIEGPDGRRGCWRGRVVGGRMRDRWETPAGRLLAEEVLARLVAGRPLDGLGLGDVAGRTDLRGLPAPTPKRLARFEAAGWFVESLGNLVRLRGLDLSGASLDSFRFHQCVIEECVLDKARCNDWRMWESRIRNTSFRGTSFRNAALGPWSGGKGNEFTGVDFTQADFRGAPRMTALYEDCDFSSAKLDKMEFQRCGLVRCRFSGPLNEVIFDARVFPGDEQQPNYCIDVDMSGVVIHLTEFLGFNLAAVKLPDEPGLRVIENFPCVLKAV